MRNSWIAAAVVLLMSSVGGAQTTRPATPSADEAKMNGKALASLDRVLPAVNFDGVGFGDVLDFLKDVSGVKIVAPWDKLKAVGVEKNKPMTLNVRNEKFADVLNVVLVKAAGKPGVLGCTVEQGEIVIVVKGATTQPK